VVVVAIEMGASECWCSPSLYGSTSPLALLHAPPPSAPLPPLSSLELMQRSVGRFDSPINIIHLDMTTDNLATIVHKLQASAESATAAYPRFRQIQLGKLYGEWAPHIFLVELAHNLP